MGQAVQRKDYVIVFTASWETFEDTLLFFHNEVEEMSLSMPWFPKELTGVYGVHAAALSEDLTVRDCFEIRDETLRECAVREPFLPAVVHFLHFGSEQEPNEHRRFSERFADTRIPTINVYDDAVANCDSKFRMSEVLERQGIPTPPARLISRFNENKQQALEGIREEFRRGGLFLQPDRGTGGAGCLSLGADLDAAVAGGWPLPSAKPLYVEGDLRKRNGGAVSVGITGRQGKITRCNCTKIADSNPGMTQGMVGAGFLGGDSPRPS